MPPREMGPRLPPDSCAHPVLEPAQLSPLAHAKRFRPSGPGASSGEFNFTAPQPKICSEGMEASSAGQAADVAGSYDFSRHRRVLDLRGGTGAFIPDIWGRHPDVESALYELREGAAMARQELAWVAGGHKDHDSRRKLPQAPSTHGPRCFLMTHDAQVLVAELHQHDSGACGFRPGVERVLLLLGLRTNAAHTEPLFAARMASEFLCAGGNGNVYSIEEVRSRLDWIRWGFMGTTGMAALRAWCRRRRERLTPLRLT